MDTILSLVTLHSEELLLLLQALQQIKTRFICNYPAFTIVREDGSLKLCSAQFTT